MKLSGCQWSSCIQRFAKIMSEARWLSMRRWNLGRSSEVPSSGPDHVDAWTQKWQWLIIMLTELLEKGWVGDRPTFRARLCTHFSVEKVWKAEKILHAVLKSAFGARRKAKKWPTFSTTPWKRLSYGVVGRRWKFLWNQFSVGIHKHALIDIRDLPDEWKCLIFGPFGWKAGLMWARNRCWRCEHST